MFFYVQNLAIPTLKFSIQWINQSSLKMDVGFLIPILNLKIFYFYFLIHSNVTVVNGYGSGSSSWVSSSLHCKQDRSEGRYLLPQRKDPASLFQLDLFDHYSLVCPITPYIASAWSLNSGWRVFRSI